ncbi:nucleoside 2-deoxyribosyltransferase domain-containing protein [Tenacibaculum amylolyticum]|uniref:nucleoside 2-deoxyribosyltransferase domain-containing protein n=1 Tax=Tenacibaculum amylolyticum TaxID=104269 RepID=UPI003894E200
MIYTSSQKLPIKKKEYQYYFLAGSMNLQKEVSWRDKIMKEISGNVLFLDPTNKNHDSLSDKEMKAHIEWELEAMELADTIILNFLPNAMSPISLVELGLHAKSGKLIVVCPDEFYKSRYVHILCKKYKIPIYKTFENIFV